MPLPIPGDFRLPNRTLMGYEQFVSAMKRHDGVRIAVLGDSIVWGGVAEPEETLSARITDVFEAAERPFVHAYNLGMNEAHANDMLPLMADITDEGAADIVLFNVDYRFYAPSEKVSRRYPDLYDMVEDFRPLEDDPLAARGRRPRGASGPSRSAPTTPSARCGGSTPSHRSWCF